MSTSLCLDNSSLAVQLEHLALQGRRMHWSFATPLSSCMSASLTTHLHCALARAESYLSADLAAAFRKTTGITGRLYDWQAECLTQEGVLNVRLGVWAAL